jgi:ribose/xylose/arabinose/galactoside ABC-type transport system permease subunit
MENRSINGMIGPGNHLEKAKSFFSQVHPLIYAIIALYIVVPLLSPRYLAMSNQLNITRQVAVYLILGVGMTFVITSKGIDLSVGSSFGFVACVTADLLVTYGASPWLAMPFALLFGCVLGLIIGLIITKLKVNPFIASLGMLVAYRGATHVYMGGKVLVRLPKEIVFLGQGNLGFIPMPALISIGIALIGAGILRKTHFGRYTVAVGSNESACRVIAGINVDRQKIIIYTIMGLMAGVAALVMIGRLNGTSATLGTAYELHVIATVVLGGTFLHGGKGTMLGTFLGAYVMGILENAMVLVGADFHTQRILVGSLLVLAVALQGYNFRRKGVLEASSE